MSAPTEGLREAGYPASEKQLSSFLLRHFQVTRTDARHRRFGHASVRQVMHAGTWKWACLAAKQGNA